ncbi:MAG: flippase-like domain-containing protein [Flavobacteriaceae bacterium]
MLTSNSYKSNQFLWLVFKLFIVIVCGYYIFLTISSNQHLDFSDFWSFLTKFDVFSTKNIVFLFIFTIFNWFFEISKWQILVKKIQLVPWSTAAKQSLASLTFSLITPNRIGEYPVKALYFEKGKRKRILMANFAGNMYQLLVTVLIGLAGVFYLINYFSFSTQQILLFILGSIFLFFIIRFLLKKLNWFDKIYNAAKQQKSNTVLLLSILRYIVFSHQFYFFLVLFNIDITYWEAMACISSMYVIASIIPMLSLFDFVVKGSVAVFVFSFFEIDPVIILSISTLMWVYNFAIPAIIGSYFVLTFKPTQA